MTAGTMPEAVQKIYDPLWQDITLLHAKRQLAQAWFWDRDAFEVLRWGAGPAILVVRDSVSHDLIVSIQRLLDSARQGEHENLCLERLVQAVKAARPGDEADNLNRDLIQIRNRHRGIKTWRNKRSGHRDLKIALDANPMPGLTADSIRTAVVDIGEFMNRILRVFENVATHWEPWGYPETERLVFHLKEAGVVPPSD